MRKERNHYTEEKVAILRRLKSVGFSLIGIFSGCARLHVAHSKDEKQSGEWDTIHPQKSV
jgi:hypothetical protein